MRRKSLSLIGNALCCGLFFGGLNSAVASLNNGQQSVAPAPQGAPLSMVGAAPALPAVLTYQAWKSLRTDEARLILERLTLEGQIFAASNGAPGVDRMPGERQAVVAAAPTNGNVTSPSSRSLPRASVRARQDNRQDSRVEQARMNLEIAQDLTINDYLQIYLSHFKTPDVLRDVARRMNPDEVAELLIAYQKTASIVETANAASSGGSRLCSGAIR